MVLLSPQVSNVNTFGDSWLVSAEEEECSSPPGPVNPCDENDEALAAAEDACYDLISPFGEWD